MIRINLLGIPKPKSRRSATAVSAPTVATVAGFAIIAALTVSGNYMYYLKIQSDNVKLQDDLRTADMENRRLSEVKLRYTEREKIKDNYKRRVDVIDQLRANQSGPITLLSTIGSTVDSTEAVWLSTMADDGNNITLKGTALSVHGVADLMKNLQRTGYFKSVELKETYQDEKVLDMQAFVFTLICSRTAPANAGPKKS